MDGLDADSELLVRIIRHILFGPAEKKKAAQWCGLDCCCT